MVGTMMANRKGIPDELKNAGNREIFSTSIHFEETAKDIAINTYTVKTKSKGTKNVLLLSTTRPLLGITKDDAKHKPAIYKLYDFTKGGTDIVDQKMSTYTCKAKSKKWKHVAFYYMLDTARVNAQTILALRQGKNPRQTNSFEVAFDLVLSLVRDEIVRRPRKNLPKMITPKMIFMSLYQLKKRILLIMTNCYQNKE